MTDDTLAQVHSCPSYTYTSQIKLSIEPNHNHGSCVKLSSELSFFGFWGGGSKKDGKDRMQIGSIVIHSRLTTQQTDYNKLTKFDEGSNFKKFRNV